MNKKKRWITTGVVAMALGAGAGVLMAAQQDPPGMDQMPDFPEPQKEHQWLQQLVGEWTTEMEIPAGPGEQPLRCTGTETVRSLGGRWIVSNLESTTPMGPMQGVMTVGYDPAKGKYVGTWVDSMTDHLWIYEGTVDPTGKILTLETTGPDMMDPASGKTMKYRDVVEMKGPDQRTMTSFVQLPDGSWQQMVQGTAKRKK